MLNKLRYKLINFKYYVDYINNHLPYLLSNLSRYYNY